MVRLRRASTSGGDDPPTRRRKPASEIGGPPEVGGRGFPDSGELDRRLGRTPVDVRRLVTRFALAGVIAVAAVGIITAWASQREANDQAISDARRVTLVAAAGIVQPLLVDSLVPPRSDAAALARLDSAVRRNVLDGSLVRVKVWAADGTIVYSDEARLIGRRFALEDDKREVFATGSARADVSNLDLPENAFESESKLLEVYTRVHSPAGVPLLVEAYFRYSGVTAVGRSIWARFAPIALGSLIALELIQIPVAWSLARRLRAEQAERERLLRRAIDASEIERRRIASDLHDGVVQELTGVSLSLAAAHRQRGDIPVLDDSARRIRDTVKALRSLLVEIYPPNLHDEGLDAALGDLLGTLATRGVAVDVRVDPSVHGVAPHVANVVYRVAQEALRNVGSHSRATTASIDARVTDGLLRMEVADDGVGFDADTLEARHRAGHLGLRALAGTVRDAGGGLTVQSSPGRGTRVRVELPAGAGDRGGGRS